MKRQYLHWTQKKLSRMDNTWRDNIYIQHRRSYQEWTIHEETILTLSTEEAIKNGQYMKRQYLHWEQDTKRRRTKQKTHHRKLRTWTTRTLQKAERESRCSRTVPVKYKDEGEIHKS
jgi:hypothetical protein